MKKRTEFNREQRKEVVEMCVMVELEIAKKILGKLL